MNITKRYIENKGIIYGRAWYYARKYQVDFYEMLTEAHYQFCLACFSFDRKKGMKFSTWIYRCLSDRLPDYVKEKLKKSIVSTDLIIIFLEQFGYNDDILDSIVLEQKIKRISKEAQTIIRIVLYPTRQELRKIPMRITKNVLKDYLHKKKWKITTIERAFEEIKDILCN